MEITYTEHELNEVSDKLLSTYSNVKVWLLNGEMGAGKTTLIKHLCKKLDVLDEMGSPTFSIVNEYLNKADQLIYHFDFYRIEEVEEAINIGVEDYFFSGSFCFIEWADLIRDLLPDNYLEININLVDLNTRHLTTSVHE